MRNYLKIILIACCCGISTAPAATEADLVPLFEAHYSLYSLGIKLGESVRSLRRDEGDRYRFESFSYTTGLIASLRDDRIRESSVWRWHEGQVQPLKYAYHHEGSKKQRHVEIFFDWDTLSATNVVKGDPWTLTLQPGSLDKLVYQIALMRDLQRGDREISYTVADGGNLKRYSVDFAGEEELKTSLGTLKTLKFVRASGHNDKRVSALWCAPALNYLPVRIEHQEPGGERVVSTLDSVSGIVLSQ